MEYTAIIQVWFDADSSAEADRIADEISDDALLHDAVKAITTLAAESRAPKAHRGPRVPHEDFS